VGVWLLGMKAAGVMPEAKMLKEMAFGSSRADLEKAEKSVIQAFNPDLNIAMTAVGHANSKDSKGKILRARLDALEAEVAELRAENSMLKLQRATLSATLHELQCCERLQHATQRTGGLGPRCNVASNRG
jgi:hypothetical protein